MTKSLLLICTNCGENYTDKQLYIDHWKVKRGLRRVPTEGEIFDPENTVTVVVETTNEIPFMETNNVQPTENLKSEQKSTDEYKPHLLHNTKIEAEIKITKSKQNNFLLLILRFSTCFKN